MFTPSHEDGESNNPLILKCFTLSKTFEFNFNLVNDYKNYTLILGVLNFVYIYNGHKRKRWLNVHTYLQAGLEIEKQRATSYGYTKKQEGPSNRIPMTPQPHYQLLRYKNPINYSSNALKISWIF